MTGVQTCALPIFITWDGSRNQNLPTDSAEEAEKVEAGQKDHSAVLSIVVSDIEALTKNVAREFRKLKNPRRPKPRIGFHIPEEK